MSGIRKHAGPRSGRALHHGTRTGARAVTVAAAAAAAVTLLLASPAGAAQPNHHACLGYDVRAYAEAGSGFGTFVSGSLAPGGAGTEIQAHLAGAVPEQSIPNTCND